MELYLYAYNFQFCKLLFYYVFSLLFVFVAVVVTVVNKECAIWRWTQPERWCGIICLELAQNGSNWPLSQCIFGLKTTTLMPSVHLDLANRIRLFSFFVELLVFLDIFSSRVRVDIVQNIRTMPFCIVAVCLMFWLNIYFYFTLQSICFRFNLFAVI